MMAAAIQKQDLDSGGQERYGNGEGTEGNESINH